MRKTFIIECDSSMDSVFLYEAESEYEYKPGEVDRQVAVRGEKITNEYPTPKFYGILDSLLITAERVRNKFANVRPIIPEPPRTSAPAERSEVDRVCAIVDGAQ